MSLRPALGGQSQSLTENMLRPLWSIAEGHVGEFDLPLEIARMFAAEVSQCAGCGRPPDLPYCLPPNPAVRSEGPPRVPG